jgi:hypothetical protein
MAVVGIVLREVADAIDLDGAEATDAWGSASYPWRRAPPLQRRLCGSDQPVMASS